MGDIRGYDQPCPTAMSRTCQLSKYLEVKRVTMGCVTRLEDVGTQVVASGTDLSGAAQNAVGGSNAS